MDPNTFLYGEEIILSERMKSIGKYSYYYPDVSILHEHGATIRKNKSQKMVSEMTFESESYYYSKYMNVPQVFIYLGKLSHLLYTSIKTRLK